MFETIKENDNHGKPYKNLEIINSEVTKIMGKTYTIGRIVL